jgi:hypothetical protein
LIALTGSLSKAFMARQLGVSFDREYYFNPEKRHQVDQICNAYAKKSLSEFNVFFTESNLGQFRYYTDRQVLVGGIQPNMILGMLIGAEFIPHAAMDADISMTPLAGRDRDELPEPKSLLDHELVRLFDRQINTIRSQGKLEPIPPFFWDASGRTTIHGVLTTAQKFVGENLLMDLMTEPDRTDSLLEWIAESFIVLIKHFSEVGRLPITSLHIGECSGCMVNPELFERFVASYASRITAALGPLRFHSCGRSTHLLASMKKIANLASLDLGGETSVKKVREIFGNQFPIDISPITADFSADSPEMILKWVKQVVEDNTGGPLRILYHLEPDYSLDNVRAMIHSVNTL